jgi:hypothetical protein
MRVHDLSAGDVHPVPQLPGRGPRRHVHVHHQQVRLIHMPVQVGHLYHIALQFSPENYILS